VNKIKYVGDQRGIWKRNQKPWKQEKLFIETCALYNIHAYTYSAKKGNVLVSTISST